MQKKKNPLLFSPILCLLVGFEAFHFVVVRQKTKETKPNNQKEIRKTTNIFETIIQQKINLMCKIYDMNQYIKLKGLNRYLKSACKQRCHIDSKMNLFFCGQRSVCFMSQHDKHNSNTL